MAAGLTKLATDAATRGAVAGAVKGIPHNAQYYARKGAKAALQKARSERVHAEQTISGFREIERDIRMIYDDHWSTPERRLTQLLLELRAMENRSRLVPQMTSFAMTETTKEFGTREMGIQFTVMGTYAQIRQLINLIELSPHFVVIDSISLTVNASGAVRLSTVPLITPEELDAASKKGVKYRAPGA